jgi:hypothetical protein
MQDVCDRDFRADAGAHAVADARPDARTNGGAHERADSEPDCCTYRHADRRTDARANAALMHGRLARLPRHR